MIWKLLVTFFMLALCFTALAATTRGRFNFTEQDIYLAAFYFIAGALVMELWQ